METYHNVMQDFLEPMWSLLFPKSCIPSKHLKCSSQFYQYLMADGVFIHNDYLRDKSEQLVKDQSLLFPQVEKIVNEALTEYKSVFVKVNWRSAKDSKSWLGGLECTHIEDVFKIIKCSSYIAEALQDYEHLYPEHLYLILKKYQNLDRNLEFRCFINKETISACQRSTEHVFVDIENKNQYYQKITKFIKQTVIPKFNKQKFVVDLYVPKKRSIKIIDISPWREFTNPLLFQWKQLESKEEGQFKVIEEESEVMYEDLGNYNKPNEEEMKWLMQQIAGYKG